MIYFLRLARQYIQEHLYSLLSLSPVSIISQEFFTQNSLVLQWNVRDTFLSRHLSKKLKRNLSFHQNLNKTNHKYFKNFMAYSHFKTMYVILLKNRQHSMSLISIVLIDFDVQLMYTINLDQIEHHTCNLTAYTQQ